MREIRPRAQANLGCLRSSPPRRAQLESRGSRGLRVGDQAASKRPTRPTTCSARARQLPDWARTA